MTTVVISQPMYFPWPGFFELVATADIYVHLDDVQFSKGGFTNRIQIKHENGVSWMTIPLEGKGTFQRIRDLVAADQDWKRAHRSLLARAFRESPSAEIALGLFDRIVTRASVYEIMTASIEEPACVLGLPGPKCWVAASALGISGTSWQRVLAIVTALGGTRYVTAHGAANYLNHEAFESAGVAIEYVDYSKTSWSQRHGPFTPFVSVLDLIANEGGQAGHLIQPATKPWRSFLMSRTSP